MRRRRNKYRRNNVRRRRKVRPCLSRPFLPSRQAVIEPLEARLVLAADPLSPLAETGSLLDEQQQLSILASNGPPPNASNGDTFALFDALPSAFFYKNTMGPGLADGITQFGPAGADWTPLAGDWDADGADSFGLFDHANSVFFLKDTIGPGPAETIVQFGPPGQGWLPLVGDWDGDGTSTVGLFEPVTSSFFLKNSSAAGPADVVFQFGPAGAGWTPVVGDWDGDGVQSVALYSGSGFYLKNTFEPGIADAVFSFGPDEANWVPLAGDYNGDGTDTVALFEPINSVFFYKNSNEPGPGDGTVQFGPPGAQWTPLAGDWDGTTFEAPSHVEIEVPNLLTLEVGEIEYLDPSTVVPGEPVARLHGATLTWTGLPEELASAAGVTLDDVAGYDDDGDGLIDGFELSAVLSLGEVDLTVGQTRLLTLAGLSLGVSGLAIRPEHNGGLRSGALVFDADEVQLLPDLDVGGESLAVAGLGSIDVDSGALQLGFDLPAAAGALLPLSGWVPLRVSRLDAAYDPREASPTLAFSLGGFIEADELAGKLGEALGAPELAVAVRRYDATGGGFVELSPTNPLTFGLAYVDGQLQPTGTPPLEVALEQLTLDVGGSLGMLELSGSLAVGGIDGQGLLQPLPAALGAPLAGQQVAGLLTVEATGGGGQIDGQITLGGTLDSANGSSQLTLTGTAQLAAELAAHAGVTASSLLGADFGWDLQVDHATLTYTGLPTLTSLEANDLSLVVEDVIRFDVSQIEYLSSPPPGSPVAHATDATLTLLGVLGDADVSGSADLALFDDDGDGVIDGIALEQAQLSMAQSQSWDYPAGGAPLLRVADLTATLSEIAYRSALGGFDAEGLIELSLGEVSLYPEGGGSFNAVVQNATGSIDAATGELAIHVGELAVGLGPESLFEIEVQDAVFRLDADDATDILTVEQATLRLQDPVGSLDAASFRLDNFRFNLVDGNARFGIDSVQLDTPQGLLGTVGLAGFVPLNITQAALSFADDGAGYTNFASFVLAVDGYFNLNLLESVLPFEPILSIGDVSAGNVENPHTFTGIEFAFDVAEGRIAPVQLSDITVGFADWRVGELIFAGELVAAGYVDGVLLPSITGSVGIDVGAAGNRVRPADSNGLDLYGAEIGLTGTIVRGAGMTSLVIDAEAGLAFDLNFGDFLQLSDLGFQFGLDIVVADQFLDDPPGLIDVTTRLESMSVGALTASLGDYLSLGAVPGSGGEPGLLIDFDPDENDPLATFNFNLQSPLIGIGGTIDGLAILQGGVPDFNGVGQIDIALVSRGDGSPSLLQDLFSEFLPLNISRIALAFQDGFFETEGPAGDEVIVGIADPTRLHLITSGQAGLPDWFPAEFGFEIGSEFSNLELDLAKLVNGEFAIVDLGGLGFEVGVDMGAFTLAGAMSVGSVDADPGTADEPVFYGAIEGAFEVGGYGAAGTLVLTTAGPVGATLSVPLAIPIAQTGFLITGAAGSIQFGTVLLPEPEEIQRPADLGNIPNPFDIDLRSPQAIEEIVQGLWVTDAGGGYVRPTWTEPVTLALQGRLTHVAVAQMLTGTVTVAANLTLPIGGATVEEAGLALLGFGDIRAFDIPLAGVKAVFDLRDELNPSLGFYFQAPATGNPLGILLPAQADFGALLRTDGLAMATGVGLRAFFIQLADGLLPQGQVFFESVASEILSTLQSQPDQSALAEELSPLLPAGQTFADLDVPGFLSLVQEALDFDDALQALGLAGGQTVDQLPPELQETLATAIAVSNAAVQDLLVFAPRIIEQGLNDALSTGQQLVAMGLREPGQENDPTDPFGLLDGLGNNESAIDRVVPLEFASEFTSVLLETLGSAVSAAFAQSAAFAASDSFDPRLLVEGALQPTLLGIPAGDAPGSVQLTVSKRGVSFGLDASIVRMLKLIGGAPLGPLAVLMNAAPDVTDQTTMAYELPFNEVEVLQSLAEGGLSLSALNPFAPDWGQLVVTQLQAIALNVTLSMVQFGPGSTLLENNIQIVDDFDDPVEPGKIPLTSQALLDRMRNLGGFLATGGVLQAKLLTDPFEVISNLIDAAEQAGEELESPDDQLQYLLQLFSTVPTFLEAVQDSLKEMEEFARVQAYLPISYATLLPQQLQDLLEGNVDEFNEAFLTTFFDENGNIRDDAVLEVLDNLGDQIQDSASTIAANMFFEGVLNSKLLGIELANGRLFGGVLPDPDNPGETLDYGNSAITVTGEIPWLGGLQVEAVLDKQILDLPDPPLTGPDPLADLRAFYGDTIPLPRGRFELALDTTSPPSSNSDFDKVISNLGLDTSLFQLPTVGQADASIRAYTPGYDLTSSDPIQRVGGLEFLANLSVDQVVDSAAFTLRMTAPVVGPDGLYVPFAGHAAVDQITLGGLTLTDAELELVSGAEGIRIGIKGTAELLGALFTVEGELDDQFRGNLTMHLKSGETLAGAFGGFSGAGSFTLMLDGPADGAIAFEGRLSDVPGTGSSNLNVSGLVDANGDFDLASSATNVNLAGFAVESATLRVKRVAKQVDVHVEGHAAMSLLGSTFGVAGTLRSNGAGTLSLNLASGAPDFGGLAGNGDFELVLASPTSGSVSFDGSLSNVPGMGAASLGMSGSISSNGNFSVRSGATNLSLAGFSINSAQVTVARDGSTTSVALSGNSSLNLLGANFRASGSLDTGGRGTLTLAQTGGSPSFGGLVGNGTFELVLSSPASSSVSFDGSLSNVPGLGAASLAMSGTISSQGNFSVTSGATDLSLGGFLINSAVVTVARNGSTTSIAYSGNSSLILLGATFRVSGSLDIDGSGTLSLTRTGGTPSFGGLAGSGTFELVLTSSLSGNVSFDGSLSNVPGMGSASLVMSGTLFFNGNFSVTSGVTNLSLGGFAINSALLSIFGNSDSASISYVGNSSLSLLGTTFRVSGSLDTGGSGTLALTQTGGTPSFGGLTGNGAFELVLASPTSGSVTFDGTVSNVPGKGSASLAMSGSISSNGNFSVTSGATSLSLGGFSINSAIVTVARSGSTTSVTYSGNSSLSLLGATFRVSGSLTTAGSGTLSLTLSANKPSFGGFIGNGTFELVLPNPTSGSVSFDGALSNLPGKGSSSLAVSGTISSNGNFSVTSGATNLSLGGFSINSAVVTVARSGSTTSVSYSGNSSLSLLGATFRVSGSLSTAGSGTLSLTPTSGTPSFGGLAASGTFALELSSPASGFVSFSGLLSSVPGKGAATLAMSGSVSSNGNFSVTSGATNLSLGGFSISSAVVTVARSGGSTSVSYSGNSSLSLLGATFRVSGSLSTSGGGTLTLTRTGGSTSFGGLAGSGTFALVLSNASSGSVSFNGSISNVPGKGSSSLTMSGSVFFNGNFSLSSNATNLTFGTFSVTSAEISIIKIGSTVNVNYSGDASLGMLGASFRTSGSLNPNGTGTLELTLTSGTPKFFGATASGTFTLHVTNGTSASVAFDGSVSNIPGGFVSSIDVAGTVSSPTSYAVTGSTTVTRTIFIVGEPAARIRGTFNLTLSSNGFSASIPNATIETRAFDAQTGQFYWQVLIQGPASINSNGTGVLGPYSFTY